MLEESVHTGGQCTCTTHTKCVHAGGECTCTTHTQSVCMLEESLQAVGQCMYRRTVYMLEDSVHTGGGCMC